MYDATCLDFGGIIPFAGKSIAVTHGHLTAEVRRLLSVEPNYLLCGHTHATEDRHHGSTRVINPGALHRARVFTVATLDLATDTLEFVTVPR